MRRLCPITSGGLERHDTLYDRIPRHRVEQENPLSPFPDADWHTYNAFVLRARPRRYTRSKAGRFPGPSNSTASENFAPCSTIMHTHRNLEKAVALGTLSAPRVLIVYDITTPLKVGQGTKGLNVSRHAIFHRPTSQPHTRSQMARASVQKGSLDYMD